MTVTVLDSKRIQISDWRPVADTTYVHTGAYTVDGNTIQLDGYEIGTHDLVELNGITYKAIHRPTVMSSTASIALYPLTDDGQYFSMADNLAFRSPRELSMMLRVYIIGAATTGTHCTLISKGSGVSVEWELYYDSATGAIWFYDGVNGGTSSLLAVTTNSWSKIGFAMSDDALTFWINGTKITKTQATNTDRPQTTGSLYIGAMIDPAFDGVEACWDWVTVWDERIADNAMDNALDYLKIQERGLIGSWPFPHTAAATITDQATAYEVQM